MSVDDIVLFRDIGDARFGNLRNSTGWRTGSLTTWLAGAATSWYRSSSPDNGECALLGALQSAIGNRQALRQHGH